MNYLWNYLLSGYRFMNKASVWNFGATIASLFHLIEHTADNNVR